MNSLKKILPVSAWALPALVFAQGSGIEGAVNSISDIINAIIPLLIGVALVVFLYGVVMYVVRSGAEDKGKAINYIIYGIIGLFVMVSVWGLVNLVQDTLEIGEGSVPDAPGIPNN